MDEEFADFVRRESRETLYGLYRALWDRRWVNPPHVDVTANYKVRQLLLAQQVGFRTPRTIVTNDPDEALVFFRACGDRMVYKLMRPIFTEEIVGEAYGVYTTLITEDDLDANLDSVRMAPCLFQEFVAKDYELRVNVIGNYIWAAAIYSQDVAQAQVDYRLDTTSCRHAPVLLPPELEKVCLKMARELGLRMGNIDLIFTPDEEYVFLEINPNGQWAWVEDYVGFPLTTALVDELLGVDTLADHPYIKRRSLRFEANTAIKMLA